LWIRFDLSIVVILLKMLTVIGVRIIYFFIIKKHPKEMGKDEIEEFLTHLATKENVAPTTQNQAFNAILFMYKEVLGVDTTSWDIQAYRAKELNKDIIQSPLDF